MTSPTFGVSHVGKKFTWITHDDDGEPFSQEFRARASIPFDTVLEYRAIGARLQMEGQLQIEQLRRRGDSLDGEASKERPVEEIKAELMELAERTASDEAARWEALLEQTLLLVHPPHVAKFRPLLEAGDPVDVRALRSWLIGEVIDRAPETVEEVAGVDPTLPPPPQSSPPNGLGGQDSDPKELSSTD